MKLEKQACMLALAAILLLIVGAFVVGFPAGATLAEETDIDLNAFEGSVILDDPVYFQEATPDEPEVKPTQQPTIEPTQAPGEQPTVEPTHEPTAEPAADAQVIAMAMSIFNRLGLADDIEVSINAIGCPTCRAEYRKALRTYFEGYKDQLCETCNSRLERNPMRILDCKSPVCGEIAKGAPKITDYLCDDCRAHFEKVQTLLKSINIPFSIDPGLVRGLDYYTRTVFEFPSKRFGFALGGGGRYDGLVEEVGGKPTPALGFGLGLDRILMAMNEMGADFGNDAKCEVYIASLGEAAQMKAFQLTEKMHSCGIAADCDLCARGLKAQMKYADKIGAQYSIVLGDDEIANGEAVLKNMKTGEKKKISLNDDFVDTYITAVTEQEDAMPITF